MKLVKNVTKNWSQMDGATDREKKINAFLTKTFISNSEAASDECLSYAKQIVKYNDSEESVEKIVEMLDRAFNRDSEGEKMESFSIVPDVLIDISREALSIK